MKLDAHLFVVLRAKIQTGKVYICSVLSDLVMFIKTADGNTLLYLGKYIYKFSIYA